MRLVLLLIVLLGLITLVDKLDTRLNAIEAQLNSIQLQVSVDRDVPNYFKVKK